MKGYCAECGSSIANILLEKCGAFHAVGYACCPQHAAKACARIEQYQGDGLAVVAWRGGILVADAEGPRDDDDGGLSYTRNAHTCVGGEGA